MADPVEVVRVMLTGSSAVAVIFGSRGFRADAVTGTTPRPYFQLTLTADEPDYDLDGTIDDTTATITFEAVVDSTDVGAALLVSAIPLVRSVLNAPPATLLGVTIVSMVTLEAGDEPNGPADTQGETAFERSLTVQITYR